jgi:RHH-type proline utilization regulon transcriptional repressor/proline dehydrogenase/delta 1-pyrroline-5-carboxylate dehydrogenase
MSSVTNVANGKQWRSSNANLESLSEKAIEFAAEILQRSRARETREDKRIALQTRSLVADETAKQFTIAMVDEVLRIRDPRRAAAQLAEVIDRFGIPKSFPPLDRFLLGTARRFAGWMPSVVMPQVRRRIRAESSHVILSAEPSEFNGYLRKRRGEGLRINLNQLGEAVLGDHEAERRFEAYLERLRDPSIHYVSVKLSSIVSHISLTGYADTLNRVKERLRELYRAAQATDDAEPKFINLDMEEYRDLHLTVDVFRSVLDEPEFLKLPAGIVLQAYLPDSFVVQQSLTDWARRRKERGGANIKIRLVKGANLAMEQVEASLHAWPQAPYHSKVESDANYKRMMEFALRRENIDVVRVGIASHNLFDIGLALLLSQERTVTELVDFEMLEGMANAQARELKRLSGDLLVYAPVCEDAEFESAIAYLVRRFDENTQPGSFLGDLFSLEVDSEQWVEQSERFRRACELASSDHLATSPNRFQNRNSDHAEPSQGASPFCNTPNTDFSLPANREWIQSVVEDCKHWNLGAFPIQVGGQERSTDIQKSSIDPSRPSEPLYHYACGDANTIREALEVATSSQAEWEARGTEARGEILRRFAAVCENERGSTIGVMLADSGKAVTEADTEISEAIDFAEYYSRSLNDPAWTDGCDSGPLGVVVVTPPWNFPYAIPAGGCLAALMAGNTVILKPAPETVWTAWHLARQLWAAGVPREVLQFLPIEDGPLGKKLLTDKRVGGIILTGGFATAERFQSWRPGLRLYAETSGKNSLIISSTADLDLAVKDLVRGAFGHSGQKCSATSLAIVQRDVYESDKFRSQLKDAASSLRVAAPWDLSADVTPLIRPPAEDLKRALTTLEPGESWLLEPRMVDGNPCLWSPGIKLGVRRGSWFHRTECFGPVLGLICVDSIEEAIEVQNESEYGLTGGLHSLDHNEIEHWRDRVHVGNAYINRTTTGAIVQRQPFGGWKHSAIGPGTKAGGPNYVASFRLWESVRPPEIGSALPADLQNKLEQVSELLQLNDELPNVVAAAESYHHWWKEYFSKEHDPSDLHGESNVLRYRADAMHCLRFDGDMARRDALRCMVLCSVAGIGLQLSSERLPEWALQLASESFVSVYREDTEALVHRLRTEAPGRVRWLNSSGLAPTPRQLDQRVLLRESCLDNGRIEWLRFLREQAISETTHRHGNVFQLPESRRKESTSRVVSQ